MLSHYIYIYTHRTSLWQPYRGMWQDYGPLVTATEGITVAVTSLPQYITYAELAQLSGFRGRVRQGPLVPAVPQYPSSPFRQGSSLLGHLWSPLPFWRAILVWTLESLAQEKWEARTFTVGNRSEHRGYSCDSEDDSRYTFHIQIEVAWKWGFPLMLLSSFVPYLIYLVHHLSISWHQSEQPFFMDPFLGQPRWLPSLPWWPQRIWRELSIEKPLAKPPGPRFWAPIPCCLAHVTGWLKVTGKQ